MSSIDQLTNELNELAKIQETTFTEEKNEQLRKKIDEFSKKISTITEDKGKIYYNRFHIFSIISVIIIVKDNNFLTF